MKFTKIDSRAKVKNHIYQVVLMAIFSAFGYVLMILGKVIPFGPFSFLEVEISDLTVLLTYTFVGYFPSLIVAIIKTLLAALTFGFVGIPIPIGQITALISSFLGVSLLLLADKCFYLANKKLISRVIIYILIGVINSFVLSLLNYLFITPTFMTFGSEFLTCFDIFSAPSDSGIMATFNEYFGALKTGYTGAIFAIYIPFNLLKSFMILTLYEVLCFKAVTPLIKHGQLKFKLSSDDMFVFKKMKKLPVNKTTGAFMEKRFHQSDEQR